MYNRYRFEDYHDCTYLDIELIEGENQIINRNKIKNKIIASSNLKLIYLHLVLFFRKGRYVIQLSAIIINQF